MQEMSEEVVHDDETFVPLAQVEHVWHVLAPAPANVPAAQSSQGVAGSLSLSALPASHWAHSDAPAGA